jgi:cytoskeleton protein RodZ
VGEFGDKFRKAREKKELSLDDVSNVTKISTRMLQAIEEENFEQLPGGVFNRGFIRAYAKHLGLDSEEAVNDYLACLRQAQVDSHDGWDLAKTPAPQPPVATKPKPARPVKPEVNAEAPPVNVEELPELQLPRAEHIRPAKKEYLSSSSGISWLRIAAAVCLLISVFFLWTRHSRNNGTAGASSSSPHPAPSTTVAAAPPVAPSTPPSQSPTPPAPTTAALSPQPPAQSEESGEPSSENPPAAKSAPAPSPAPPSPAPPAGTSADQNQVKVEKKGDVTIRSFGAAGVKPAEKPAATLKLIVRATENSWISVTSDGQLVTQETLIAPAATSFHATRELVVRVGNAAGVSFLWNGEEVQPQGAESEAKTFIFDAQGMHTSTPPQPSQP